ncbi:MAG: sigma-54-dependent Fis family transcriptional regulator [Deltaproteobacteria bacterium]|nr:sigma-54-dependent Fis family transcriptional regulator [Deltaproteobacteria bacterium]
MRRGQSHCHAAVIESVLRLTAHAAPYDTASGTPRLDERKCDMTVREHYGIRTRSPRMQRVLDLIERFAALEAPVLIQGETGTGKEVVAQALHRRSARAQGPLVVIDCGALPESIVESELFGHERGSFTGADRSYAGRILAAANGTLVLDEANSISSLVQGKLLRFVETGQFARVGSQRPVAVDARLICATNVPLETLVSTGQMRSDFFYRLNVLRIDLPPLRERLEDVPLLVEQFLTVDALARSLGVVAVASDVLHELQTRDWPGNVRQLLNFLRRASVLGCERGVLVRLPEEETPLQLPDAAAITADQSGEGLREWIRDREREYLRWLLDRHDSVAQQAAVAGLPQRTLYRKVRQHGLR